MKYIKLFESTFSKIPLYSKGEVVIVSKKGNVSYEFLDEIAKKLGYSVVSRHDYESIGYYDYLIKTPVGKEDQAGQDFVDNYPEFFESYFRRDLNWEAWQTLADEIEDDAGSLCDLIGVKGYIDPNVNEVIDRMISNLNKLRQ